MFHYKIYPAQDNSIGLICYGWPNSISNQFICFFNCCLSQLKSSHEIPILLGDKEATVMVGETTVTTSLEPNITL